MSGILDHIKDKKVKVFVSSDSGAGGAGQGGFLNSTIIIEGTAKEIIIGETSFLLMSQATLDYAPSYKDTVLGNSNWGCELQCNGGELLINQNKIITIIF